MAATVSHIIPLLRSLPLGILLFGVAATYRLKHPFLETVPFDKVIPKTKLVFCLSEPLLLSLFEVHHELDGCGRYPTWRRRQRRDFHSGLPVPSPGALGITALCHLITINTRLFPNMTV